MMDAFANRLRSLREMNGMSQQQIADSLQVHRSTYSYYELGTSQPPFATLIKLAKLFKVEPNFLLGFKSETSSTLHSGESYYVSQKKDTPKYVCDLSSDEQKLVMLYRLISNKEGAITALKDILHCENS